MFGRPPLHDPPMRTPPVSDGEPRTNMRHDDLVDSKQGRVLATRVVRPSARVARPSVRQAALIIAVGMVALAALVGCDTVTGPGGQGDVAHPDVDIAQPCSSCKETGHDYRHEAPFTDADCSSCHDLESWSHVVYTHEVEEFNDGFHAVVGCVYCHTAEVPVPPADCGTCHEPTHKVTKPCTNCHNANTWHILEPLPEGHVSLSNGHSELSCFSCHLGKQPFERPKQCVECHGVKHGGLTECSRCHDPSRGWKPKPGFSHDAFFPLTGRHAKLECAKCHPNEQFAGMKTTCVFCHGVKHGGLRDCASCHTTAGFKPSTFRHSTRFRLVGAHDDLKCSACHPRRQFANVIGAAGPCTNCHGVKHGGLTDCDACHRTTRFVPATFRHSTRFVLTGRHRDLRCSKCHPSNRYAQVIGLPPGCADCHGVKHGNQYDCEKCHTTSGFSPIKKIEHPVYPPISGKHAEMKCTLCHPTLVFNRQPKPCADCHDAPHPAAQPCLDCHTPTAWRVSHAPIGYHTNLPILEACRYCHANANYATYQCDACHAPL